MGTTLFAVASCSSLILVGLASAMYCVVVKTSYVIWDVV